MSSITREELIHIDAGIKSLHRAQILAGLCKDLSEELTTKLTDKHGVTPNVVKFMIGPHQDPHYAVVITRKHLADEFFTTEYDAESTVIVDPTIKQFSVENAENTIVNTGLAPAADLPELGIYPPNAPKRVSWYHHDEYASK
jgi:hypothetical protein